MLRDAPCIWGSRSVVIDKTDSSSLIISSSSLLLVAISSCWTLLLWSTPWGYNRGWSVSWLILSVLEAQSTIHNDFNTSATNWGSMILYLARRFLRTAFKMKGMHTRPNTTRVNRKTITFTELDSISSTNKNLNRSLCYCVISTWRKVFSRSTTKAVESAFWEGVGPHYRGLLRPDNRVESGTRKLSIWFTR